MADDEGYLALRWNNHNTIFTRILNVLREQETYTDVSVAAGGRVFPAHKFVLSTCSDYFRLVLGGTPCTHPVVVLKDTSARDLEALLDFMYKGEVHVAQSELGSLLRTAENLQVKGLAVPDESGRKPPLAGSLEAISGQSGVASQQIGNPTLDLASLASTPTSSEDRTDLVKSLVGNTSDLLKNLATFEARNPSTPSKDARLAALVKRKKSTGDRSKKDTPPKLTPKTEVSNGISGGRTKGGKRPSSEGGPGMPELKRAKIGKGLSKDLPESLIAAADIKQEPDGVDPFPDMSLGVSSPQGDKGGDDGALLAADMASAELLQVDLSEDGTQFIIGPGFASPMPLDASSGGGVVGGDVGVGGVTNPRKPFVCPLCGNDFTRRDNLANHLKTHTGDKPYSCSVCKKCFSRKDYLKQHERIHSGEKPYQCTLCRRAFTRKEGLVDHMRGHSESKQFACDTCGKDFKQKCGLRFHKRNYLH